MRRLIILIVVSVLFSCQHQKTNTTEGISKDSFESKLLGCWGSDKGAPVWKFKEDSVYYVGTTKVYPYRVVFNSIIVDIPGAVGILANAYVIKDTLFFKDPCGGGIIKGFKCPSINQ